jgi:hypothetical protein
MEAMLAQSKASAEASERRAVELSVRRARREWEADRQMSDDQKRSEISSLLSKMSDLEKLNQTQSDQLKQYELDLYSLRSELISVRSSVAAMSSSPEDPQQNLDDSTIVESVDGASESTDHHHHHHHEVVDELREKVSQLENELNDVRQRLEESSNLRAELDEEVRNHKSSIQSLSVERDNLLDRLSESSSTGELAEQRLSLKSRSLEETEARVQFLTDRVKVLEDELSILREADDRNRRDANEVLDRSLLIQSSTSVEMFTSHISHFTSSLNRILMFLTSSLRKPLVDHYLQFKTQISLILESVDRFLIYLTWFRDISERYHRLHRPPPSSSFTSGLLFMTSLSPAVGENASPPVELPSSTPSDKTIHFCHKLIQQQQFCILSQRLLIRSYKADLTQLLSSQNTSPTPPPPQDRLSAKSKQILLRTEFLSQDLSRCIHQIDFLREAADSTR